MTNKKIRFSYVIIGNEIGKGLSSDFYGCYSSEEKVMNRVKELSKARREIANRNEWEFDERITRCEKNAAGENFAAVDLFTTDSNNELTVECFNIFKSPLL